MFKLGVAGAGPRELSWVLAVDLRAAGVDVTSVVPDLQAACGPTSWDEVDVWMFWPHQLSAQGWRDLDSRCLSRSVPLVASCRDREAAVAALRHGVRCLTMPGDSAWALKAAVVSAVDGQPFLSPTLLDETFACLLATLTAPAGPAPVAHRLTTRELEVLHLLAGGASNADIAGLLHIGTATVGTHVISILRKLDVANRTQAAARAHAMGLLSEQQPLAGARLSA